MNGNEILDFIVLVSLISSSSFSVPLFLTAYLIFFSFFPFTPECLGLIVSKSSLTSVSCFPLTLPYQFFFYQHLSVLPRVNSQRFSFRICLRDHERGGSSAVRLLAFKWGRRHHVSRSWVTNLLEGNRSGIHFFLSSNLWVIRSSDPWPLCCQWYGFQAVRRCCNPQLECSVGFFANETLIVLSHIYCSCLKHVIFFSFFSFHCSTFQNR